MAPSARVTPHGVGRCREAAEGPGPEGLPPQRVGERACHCPKYFGRPQGSLPPALRGHLPRRGREGSVSFSTEKKIDKWGKSGYY